MRWILIAAALAVAPSTALALPQFSVRSARACDTCHVAPNGWNDPELALRKCALNCNVCHVDPTGGRMRNAAGLFFGRYTLPMFGPRPADKAYQPVELVPSSQPVSDDLSEPPGSQPASMAAGSQPASMAAGSQPASMAAGSQPASMAAGSQPASMPAGSQPASAPAMAAAGAQVPAPGTAGRYAGIDPFPYFQLGTDIRTMLYVPLAEEEDVAFFPMQLDLYLVGRPYNPKVFNEGRLTLVLNSGFRGSRTEEFDGFHDRAFVREWWAMYHDLPYQMYVRAGRFLPAFGWRTDDHTMFTRQEQTLFNKPWDFERQVTGVEFGLNPNYFYGHLSVFNPADEWDEPIKGGDGIGSALSAGWRDLGWQAGGSLIGGWRPEAFELNGEDKSQNEIAYSIEGALNLHVLLGAPLIYLGQYMVTQRFPEEGRDITGLAAFHEIDWLIIQGLNFKTRYDWLDTDVETKFNSRHRLSAGFEWHPYRYIEIITQYRHNWENNEDRFDSDADEFFVQLHGWYDGWVGNWN